MINQTFTLPAGFRLRVNWRGKLIPQTRTDLGNQYFVWVDATLEDLFDSNPQAAEKVK